LFIEPPAVDQ
jgi:hypothetical protein